MEDEEESMQLTQEEQEETTELYSVKARKLLRELKIAEIEFDLRAPQLLRQAHTNEKSFSSNMVRRATTKIKTSRQQSKLKQSKELSALTGEVKPSEITSTIPDDYDNSKLSENLRVRITFSNVGYTVPAVSYPLMEAASGRLDSGVLTAIMGPSGSGKSTLLDILADRKRVGTVTGTIKVNGTERQSVKHFKRTIGYVTQEDIFPPTLKVGEALWFYVNCRLPHLAWEKRNGYVQDTLRILGLTELAGTYIGGAMEGGLIIRGVSGGQRKRVSIGCALVSQPRVLFLDEPTSGLDSFSAEYVMQGLKDLAESGRTIATVIHQPRSSIVKMIDHLILVVRGYIVYSGTPLEVVSFMEDLGAPQFDGLTNPADYVLDYFAEFSRERASELFNTKIKTAKLAIESGRPPTAIHHDEQTIWQKIYAFFAITFYLTLRTVRDSFRNYGNAVNRILMHAITAVFVGLLGLDVGEGQSDVLSKVSLLFIMGVTLFLLPYTIVSLLAGSRLFFNRERTNQLYGPLNYLIAYCFSEFVVISISATIFTVIAAPMVGATNIGNLLLLLISFDINAHLATIMLANLAPAPDVIFTMGSGFGVVSMLFAGYFVTIDDMESFISWLRYISYTRYYYEAAMFNEYGDNRTLDCDLDNPAMCVFPNGQSVLDFFVTHPEPGNFAGYIGVLWLMSLVFLATSYLALRFLYR
eukprot:Lithocolla_globosa_v1_NODE_1805_length_2322_cov_7.930304.p1 type:complete len:696 gc:universal NODE_1805_length_2322_cov_7.930304:2270-183(-)